jgi:hypothetical protein
MQMSDAVAAETGHVILQGLPGRFRHGDNMSRLIRGAVVVGLAAASWVAPAQAAVVFSDDFNGILTSALNTAPDGWSVIAGEGTVDRIKSGTYSLSCFGNTGGCVDLDGTSNNAGIMVSDGSFVLQAGGQYLLTAQMSGNQRSVPYPALSGPDTLTFGFRDASNLNMILASQTIANIQSTQPFTLISLLFTVGSSPVNAKIFFEAAGGDNVGPILDDVTLSQVPLPAAAWLLGSGLLGLFAVGRRRKMAEAS